MELFLDNYKQEHTTHKRMNWFVFLIASIAGFAGFLFGFDSSAVADMSDLIINQLHLSDWQWSEVVGASLLGCFLGIPVSGFFVHQLSPRSLLQLIALGFIFGAILCSASHDINLLLLGRFMMGVCLGIGSYCAPLFIAEIAPPKHRGALVLINGLAITFGQAIAYLTGYLIHDSSASSWRYLFLLACIPAFILLIGMFFVPHSPSWLLRKYGLAKTLQVLKRIRPEGYDVLLELKEMQPQSKITQDSYHALFRKPIIYVLFIGIALGIFQQGSGINAIMYYGPILFKDLGFYPVKNAILATFILGMINFFFTVFTLFYIDKLGRRFLLLSGTLIAAVSLFAVSFLLSYSLPDQKFWILGLFCFYVMGYCISVGSLFWVLIAEIYPLSVRGRCMSIATLMQCAVNFTLSLSFLSLYNTVGQKQIFLLFGILCFIAYFFIYVFVPETKGISLEQIEKNLMAGKKIREIGISSC